MVVNQAQAVKTRLLNSRSFLGLPKSKLGSTARYVSRSKLTRKPKDKEPFEMKIQK